MEKAVLSFVVEWKELTQCCEILGQYWNNSERTVARCLPDDTWIQEIDAWKKNKKYMLLFIKAVYI